MREKRKGFKLIPILNCLINCLKFYKGAKNARKTVRSFSTSTFDREDPRRIRDLKPASVIEDLALKALSIFSYLQSGQIYVANNKLKFRIILLA